MVQISARGEIYDLYYSKPLKSRFARPDCLDIGAVWTVDVSLENGVPTDLEQASCDGEVDADVHQPWVLVRDFLEQLSQKVDKTSLPIAPALYQSAEFEKTQKTLHQLDLQDWLAELRGRCLEATVIKPATVVRVETGADCHIKRSGQIVDLQFEFTADNAKWQVNQIKIH